MRSKVAWSAQEVPALPAFAFGNRNNDYTTLNPSCIRLSLDHVAGDHAIDLCGIPSAHNEPCGGIGGKQLVRRCAGDANAGFSMRFGSKGSPSRCPARRIPSTLISRAFDGEPFEDRKSTRLNSSHVKI